MILRYTATTTAAAIAIAATSPTCPATCRLRQADKRQKAANDSDGDEEGCHEGAAEREYKNGREQEAAGSSTCDVVDDLRVLRQAFGCSGRLGWRRSGERLELFLSRFSAHDLHVEIDVRPHLERIERGFVREICGGPRLSSVFCRKERNCHAASGLELRFVLIVGLGDVDELYQASRPGDEVVVVRQVSPDTEPIPCDRLVR